MSIDKKVKSGRVRLVLLEAIGRRAYLRRLCGRRARCDAAREVWRIMSRRPASRQLGAYAAHDAQSRGRRYPEPPPQYRSEFQRDRDRIIHSNAFRRLATRRRCSSTTRAICTARA
jgi:hypothetical protein